VLPGCLLRRSDLYVTHWVPIYSSIEGPSGEWPHTYMDKCWALLVALENGQPHPRQLATVGYGYVITLGPGTQAGWTWLTRWEAVK
jgi:hypothetical protein